MTAYWFPAKKYGWGWGLPNGWQGWLVLVAYIGLLAFGVVVLRPQEHAALFFAYTFAVSAVLILVCWLKGEKPRWRWGEK